MLQRSLLTISSSHHIFIFFISIIAYLFCFFCSFGPFCTLIYASVNVRIESDPRWHRLLHYQKKIFGGVESEVARASFFLSPEGKYNPEAELQATIKAFLIPIATKTISINDDHALCRFPARKKFLLQHNLIYEKDLPRVNCTLYQTFKSRTENKAISYVFSSYYLNAPASAFGHTFIRLNQTEKPEEEGLLDGVVSYAATVDTDNALFYAFKGLFGLFPGEFTLFPYYFKVREYNDFESRDLWEYELNLNEDQRDWIISHLWELGDKTFRYYYLTQNCSYHLLGLIDVASPDLNLVSHLPLFSIPSETTRMLMLHPLHLVKKVTLRPSARSRFFARLQILTPSEKLFFDQNIDIGNENGNGNNSWSQQLELLPSESQTNILDTAIDHFDYKFAKKLLQNDEQTLKRKQYYLLARGKLSSPTRKLSVITDTIQNEDGPHFGHPSRRLGLFVDPIQHELNIKFRFAHHDLEDNQTGYFHSAITMGAIDLTYHNNSNNNRGFELNALHIVDVLSLSPISRYLFAPSWHVELAAIKASPSLVCANPNKNKKVSSCYALAVSFSPGLSYEMKMSPFATSFYFLAHNQLALGPQTHFPWTFGLEGAIRLEYQKFISLFSFLHQRNIQLKYENHFSESLIYSINDYWSAVIRGSSQLDNQKNLFFGFYHYL